ncbi:uncharacterized protein LOC143891882 [Tasmannia lanceolata]|uniref:uncharacterized protein LOC143891882 n=1 Tax=Tasmannia lanceolata TaxID=3420 RepID=UPI004063CB2A
MEVGHENVVQIITDNAANCNAAGQLIEAQFPSIFWTPCVVHTLNLALKNICAAKNVEANQVTYDECSWITDVSGDASIIKNFIMNHSMRLAIFNKFNTLREDDVGKARFVKEKVLDDVWWDSIDYTLAFTSPIYDMLRECDMDTPCLHLVYDLWDTMIEKVRTAIYRKEGKRKEEESKFFDVVHEILVARWNKSNTLLYCLAHSLNPRYYSEQWLGEDSSRVPPHKDAEIYTERIKCFKRYFTNSEDRTRANVEFAKFSMKS